jgi:hypothetical protein
MHQKMRVVVDLLVTPKTGRKSVEHGDLSPRGIKRGSGIDNNWPLSDLLKQIPSTKLTFSTFSD